MTTHTDPDAVYEALTVWNDARTLDDLSTGIVGWLEGRLPFAPTHTGPVPADLAPIREHLIALNRTPGLLTIAAQAAQNDGPWSRKAYAVFFVDPSSWTEDRLSDLQDAAENAGITLLYESPEERRSPSPRDYCLQAVTRWEDYVFRFVGGWDHPDVTTTTWARTLGDHSPALTALRDAWQITVWHEDDDGQPDALWTPLLHLLTP